MGKNYFSKFLFCAWIFITAAGNTLADTAGETSTNSLRDDLILAISTNDVERVRSMLELHPELAKDSSGYRESAVIWNEQRKSGQVHGFHHRYYNGGPPIVWAARQTNTAIIKLLLDTGAAADSMDWFGDTALNEIIVPRWFSVEAPGGKLPENDRQARLEIAGLLVDRGASIFAVTSNRWVPREMPIKNAALNGDSNLVDVLLLHQRPMTTDAEGNSVLHLAAAWARTNVLRTLAGRKMNLEATNNDGLTPLQAVSRLPDFEPDHGIGQIHGPDAYTRHPSMVVAGTEYRECTAKTLMELGARVDIFSAAALEWTNSVADLLAANPELVRQQNSSGQTVLHCLADLGRTNITRWLLQAGAPIESTNRLGQTPLEVAAKRGQTAMAEVLVDHGAVTTPHLGVATPLHSAAEQGNLSLLLVLLKGGADQNAEDEKLHQTPLDVAAAYNHEEVVTQLLARHARFKKGGNNVTTPLDSATVNNNTNLIAMFVRNGCDLNACNAEGKPPLVLASDRNNFDLLKFLLAQGADINARDNAGNTVLHTRATAREDRIPPPEDMYKWMPKGATNPAAHSMIEFLIHHGAQVNATNFAGQTPLHLMAQKRLAEERPGTSAVFIDTNAVKEAMDWLHPLLFYHADINARDTNGGTPLHSTVLAINAPVAEALVRRGADINARDHAGRTSLYLTALDYDSYENRQVATMLLKHGANVNLADNDGIRPLHQALAKLTLFGDRFLVNLLVTNGANIKTPDKAGHTPLITAALASRGGNILFQYDIRLIGDSEPFTAWFTGTDPLYNRGEQNLLLERGATINARDRLGNTALHYAAMTNSFDFIKLLLKYHADRSIRNHEGKTPLQVAYQQCGGFQLICLLQPVDVTGEIADAARRGDLPMVKAFLKAEPDSANWPWLFSSTPLQWAANYGHADVVKLLLDHGARLEAPTRVLNRQTRTIEMNSYMNVPMYESNRLWTAEYTNVPSRAGMIHFVNGTNSETTNFITWFAWASKLTPLQLALAGGHADIARTLVKRGAKVDPASAATLGLTGELKKSLEANPLYINDLFRRESWFYQPFTNFFSFGPQYNKQSGTLLHFAVRGDHKATVQFLVKAGANLSALDDDKRTPCQLAIQLGRTNLVSLLK